ncbi:trihelix transcription factor GT-2-like [Punica granatum]|uniref:Uncharacterized protein n=2 Tax=Punica granatum TaxID=22663 RepID=A0A2I0JH92_PUNGR|nr:trihelix transcription factor GT-2-like [Punica granatum]PKI55611.1 hypothetical protein CRG98_024004 [Punica granatum]
MLGGEGGGGGEEAGPPGMVGSSGENEAGQGSGEERGGGLFGSGNRWPRQETLALLKIRSDMDVAFRDSSAKGPLWEEVSRKLAELGYHRSAKKCKEKFENVYKYHKRTREGRTGKQDGKTYRFFDQLEAFDNHPQITSAPPSLPLPANVVPPPALPSTSPTNPPTAAVPSATTQNVVPNIVTNSVNYLQHTSLPVPNPTTVPQSVANPSNPFPVMSKDVHPHSTSSSTFSDEGLRGGGAGGGGDGLRHKRKRKWKGFFERLMKEVMDKQEELQKKFLEAIEKREHERLVREESWRMQEMARINREREILAQERSMAAAKDTAVMAFLQKIADQQPGLAAVQNTNNNLPTTASTPSRARAPAPPPPPPPQLQLQPVALPVEAPPPQPSANIEFRKSDNGDSHSIVPPPTSSSRWPKVEVEALIRLRTNLDSKYQENGPKGPLWEEISSQMRKLGYERSSKRCKEKWENINKYFKKVKESNKKRREDSKTCPYFQQLDAIYRERSSKIMDMAPLMVTPEQQWHPQQDQSRPDLAMDDMESEHMDHDLDEDHDDGDDEEEDGGEYEIVATSKPSTNGDTQ